MEEWRKMSDGMDRKVLNGFKQLEGMSGRRLIKGCARKKVEGIE